MNKQCRLERENLEPAVLGMADSITAGSPVSLSRIRAGAKTIAVSIELLRTNLQQRGYLTVQI